MEAHIGIVKLHSTRQLSAKILKKRFGFAGVEDGSIPKNFGFVRSVNSRRCERLHSACTSAQPDGYLEFVSCNWLVAVTLSADVTRLLRSPSWFRPPFLGH
jgi:hypothetical protein